MEDDEDDFYEDFDDEDCWHDSFDADILTGEAWCWRCGVKWHMSHEEITKEIQFQAEYMAEEVVND